MFRIPNQNITPSVLFCLFCFVLFCFVRLLVFQAFKDITPAGNCDGTEFSRKTTCISATGQAVRQACQSLCTKSHTNATAIGKRCRGFSFIDRADITNDFQNCKQNGQSVSQRTNIISPHNISTRHTHTHTHTQAHSL